MSDLDEDTRRQYVSDGDYARLVRRFSKPEHVARALSNYVFSDIERLDPNIDVDGFHGKPMDHQKICALKQMLFNICGTSKSLRDSTWTIAKNAINQRNRTIRHRYKTRSV